MKQRCPWAGNDELYIKYHDQEWGIPVFDDLKLFEMLILEGAQAGLSWITVLRKRDNYRAAFDNFDVGRIISYNEKKIGQLLTDKGIIRNRLKIESVIKNADSFLQVCEEYGNFSKYIWSFVDGKPIVNHWKNMNDIPSNTAESDAMSKDMKKRGFKFVGTTICYAYMQAVGMVNDHLVDCFRYNDLA